MSGGYYTLCLPISQNLVIITVKLNLLYKVQCFIGTSGTGKTDNLTCEIVYDNFT